eukprot:scaffold1042_cov401-Prasinococcus_capsulatus_cf.AAC.46
MPTQTGQFLSEERPRRRGPPPSQSQRLEIWDAATLACEPATRSLRACVSVGGRPSAFVIDTSSRIHLHSNWQGMESTTGLIHRPATHASHVGVVTGRGRSLAAVHTALFPCLGVREGS